MSPQFIVKRREYLGKVPRAFGGDTPTYTAWQTVKACLDIGDAQDFIRHQPKTGTWVYQIFFNNKKTK